MSTTALTRTARAKPRRTLIDWVDANLKWILIAPSIVFIGALIAFPVGYTIFLSLTNAQGAVTRPFDFVGLANYAHWLGDPIRFWPAVWRTAYFTVTALVIELVLGLGVALPAVIAYNVFQKWGRQLHMQASAFSKSLYAYTLQNTALLERVKLDVSGS